MAPIFVGSNDDNSRVRSDRVGFAISSSNPGSASEGNAYYNSTDNQLNIYDGSAWSSAGAGGNSVELTASGSISDGQPVIVQTNGKAAGVATVSIAQTIGSQVNFQSANGGTDWLSTVYDTENNKVVIFFQDTNDSSKGKAVVGTVGGGGTTISFGTPVIFFNNTASYLSAVYDETQKRTVVFFRSNTGNGRSVVGQVVGTGITFGSDVEFESGSTLSTIDSVHIKKIDRVGVFYSDHGDSSKGKWCVGKVNSTDNSISYNQGPNTFSFSATTITSIAATYDEKLEKVLILYKKSSSGIYCRIGNPSDTNTLVLNLASEAQRIHYGESSQLQSIYDPDSEKHIVVFEDEASSQQGSAYVIEISGGMPEGSFEGKAVYGDKTTFVFGSSVFGRAGISYDTLAKKVIVVFRNTGTGNNNHGNVIVGTVVGFGITFNTKEKYSEYSSTEWNSTVFDPDSQRPVLVAAPNASTPPFARMFRTPFVDTNLTENNFLGFSDAAYSDGATAKIQIAGSVDDAQVGLTTGRKHYVQRDGSLGITTGNPLVEAGVGISTTQILVRG